jgi:hypothetical protein
VKRQLPTPEEKLRIVTALLERQKANPKPYHGIWLAQRGLFVRRISWEEPKYLPWHEAAAMVDLPERKKPQPVRLFQPKRKHEAIGD